MSPAHFRDCQGVIYGLSLFTDELTSALADNTTTGPTDLPEVLVTAETRSTTLTWDMRPSALGEQMTPWGLKGSMGTSFVHLKI